MPLLIVLPLARRSGFESEGRRPPPVWMMPVTVAALLVLGVMSLRGNYLGEHREPWRDVSALAASGADGHRRLLVFVANEGEIMYDYYARRGDYSPSPMLLGVPNGFFATDPPHTMTRLRDEADLDRLRPALARGDFD